MRRGGAGGAAAPPPPAFGQLSFLGSGGPFFGQQQWWEGGVFQFSGGRMTSRGQCPRGGGCLWNPPFRKSCIRACYLCKILGNQPLRPPPPNQSVPIRLCPPPRPTFSLEGPLPHCCNGIFTPEQDNKTNVEPVHSYNVFHTRFVGPGVKGIIGMHTFNICLAVVLSLSCSGVKTPLDFLKGARAPSVPLMLRQAFICWLAWRHLP